MINPYVLLIVAAVWLSSLAGVGAWCNKLGHTAEKEQWQAREIATVNQANATIQKLQTDAREAEHRHAAELSDIATNYEKEKADVIAKKDSVIAGLRSGAVRLRDPYATRVQACVGATASVAAPAGERDGATGSELSGPTSEFLVAEASRADEVVHQLKACQDVIMADHSLDVKGPAP